MSQFIRTANALINVDRILAIRHRLRVSEGVFREDGHYLVTFDTQQEIWLDEDDGASLMAHWEITNGKGALK